MRAISLFGAVFIPPTVFVVGGTDSMAAGTALASFIVLAANVRFVLNPRALAHATVIALSIGMFLGAHLVIASTMGDVDVTRGAISIALVVVVLVGAQALSATVFRAPDCAVDRVGRILFVLLTSIALVAAMGLRPPISNLPDKVTFPFMEPSHFALAYIPMLLFVVARAERRWRIPLILAGLLLGYVLQNLTLVTGAILAAVMTTRFAFGLLLGATVVGAGMWIDFTYFTDRLTFHEDSKNLSVLVYLQGWEMIRRGATMDGFWGLGFQQLGEADLHLWTSALIASLGQDELNLRDGGFLAAKMVSEFGWIGIAFSAGLLIYCARTAFRLRRVTMARRPMYAGDVLAHCIVVSFSLDLLVRGAGYFSGSSLLFVAALMHLRTNQVARRGLRAAPSLPMTAGQ